MLFFFFFLMLILSLNHFIQQLLLFLLRKTFFFAHLFPSSPRSLCLSGCWADWLSGWLAPSPLDALWQFIYTLPVLHWDCGGEREWVRIAEALEKWNLCGGFFFCSSSLLCCWKYLTRAEKKKNLWLSFLPQQLLIITAVFHPWLYIPGWCMGLDLSWFLHCAWHRVRMTVFDLNWSKWRLWLSTPVFFKHYSLCLQQPFCRQSNQ